MFFLSTDVRGNLGCQIWISSKLPVAARVDAHHVMLEPKAATVLHSSPRLLAVCVPAGKVLLGLICAHAPIEAASVGEKDVWWDLLRSVMCRLPCRAIPVLLIDGNARFDASTMDARIHTARAASDNAERLLTMGAEACLHSAPLYDHRGVRVVTWTSPTGKDTQLDYVLLPDNLAPGASTLGSPRHAYQQSGVDHWPLLVRVTWGQPTKGTRPGVQWDRAKMRTAEGRDILRHIYATLPSVPWTYHVDDHLQLINNHVFSGLRQHFQRGSHKARQAHISPEQWQTIRVRRHARRLAARSRRLRSRELLAAVLRVWRHTPERAQASPTAAHKARRRYVAAILSEARLAKLIRGLTATANKLSTRDVAAHTPAVLASARHEGPAALYQSLRGVMRSGRRYKPPLLFPALELETGTVADPAEVQIRLAEHFAQPEHGDFTLVRDVAVECNQLGATHSVLDLASLPSLSSSAMSFLTMKDGKASGISTIPGEAYRYAALEAAAGHSALYLKMAARGQWPMLWRGVLATAIPKPHKHGATLNAWRSIALAEAVAKGIGRSIRLQLADRLQHFATQGQNGSLDGQNIGIPSHQVIAYMQLAQQRGLSMAAVFLDGRSAYYATVREYLFTHELADEHSLRGLLDILIPDSSLHDQAVAALVGPGLLAQAGIPSGLEGFLRSHLQGTWFTLQSCPMEVQHTKSGTTPGSPLADILFQFAQSSFMRNVIQELDACGLSARVSVGSDRAEPQGWADDVAVLLPMTDASQIEEQLQAAIPILDRQSRLIGIPLNYESGKSEALVSLRGAHSVKIRRDLLSDDVPQISIRVSETSTIRLRLVERYVHLGHVVTHSASSLEDIQAKSASAMQVLRRLQQTLLRNAELRPDEKVLLTASLVLAKIEFGAGLWCPRTSCERDSAHTALSRPWRAVCRRICGHSTKFLDDS